MCRGETRVLLAGLAIAFALPAQTPSWKHIAGTTIGAGLAAPATGPVVSVWYEEAGTRLLAQTAGGRVFETTDFEHWRLNASRVSVPAAAAKIQAAGNRLYSTGADNIFASEDNGRTWLNLTGFNNRSVIGGGFSSLALSPANPRELTAANDFGVWRSLDGGLSWAGLNGDLANLPARKLLGRRMLALADGSVVAAESGLWVPSAHADPEAALKSRLGAGISAAAQSGSAVYAGTADGRLAASRDGGATWTESFGPLAAPISKIWVDPERADSALAAAGNRLYRTVNGGLFWDDVTGSLPPAPIHGIAADRSAGAVYLATARGVFLGRVPLNDAGPADAAWRPVSRDLPASAAWDVRLNGDNTLTVALDGYGVFETQAPHRTRSVRLVNGADMSDRPAAPGSVVSILGANVSQGRIGSVSYPVIASSDQSSQLQVPFEAAAGVFQIALEGSGNRWTLPLTVKESVPAIFIDAEGAPLVLDAASGLVMDPNVPVRAGSAIQVLATGLGRVTPDWATGVPAPMDSPPAVRGAVTAYLDGMPAQVSKATLAPGYIGYYLVELQIPRIVNRGTSELRIVMNGEESNRVKLYLDEPE